MGRKKNRHPIEDEEGKQIGEYESETTWNPDTKVLGKTFQEMQIEESPKLLQWEKILVWMRENPMKLWKNPEFMEDPYFIGYEAPNRVCDLVRLGYVEKREKEGKFQTYRITNEGIEKANEILKK